MTAARNLQAGAVRDGWHSSRLKHVARLQYGSALPTEVRAEDGAVPVYGSNGPVGVHAIPNTRGPVIVVGRKGSHGKVRYSAEPVFVIDTAYYVDAVNASCNLRWLHYVLGTLELDENSQDTGVPGLSREAAHERRVAVPPLEEQRRIAAFLDHETARIDELVHEQERLLVLAAERLEASADQLVWFGSISVETAGPSDDQTNVVRLGHLTKSIQTGPFGSQLHAHDYVSDGTPVVNPSSIGPRGLLPESAQKVDDAALARLHQYRLAAGDVVLGRRGEMGRSALVQESESGWLLGTGSMRIRMTTELRPAFCLYVLQSRRTRSYLEDASVGSTMNNLNPEIVGRCVVPHYDLHKQDEIVARLETLTKHYDALLETANGLVRLLRERRSALITAAVTGQIDVSSWTPPDDWLSTETT